MTTLAYRDGVLAADTLITANNTRLGYAMKIGRRGRVLFGACGNLTYIQAFLAWVRAGMQGSAPVVMKHAGGRGFVFLDRYMLTFCPESGMSDMIEADFHACGSGSEYATGALASGKSPEDAVRVAALSDCLTGGEVVWLTKAGEVYFSAIG